MTMSDSSAPHETVREVKLEDASLTLHLPTEFDSIHEAIAAVFEAENGIRHVDDYTIRETYEIEEY